ncbi:RTA1 like protein [Penicillium camemberti]|uniref:RTA1 like protein n=1 Tax=Penicillium camemberti (strain FM 013) TaxID=1429867 RepID=A0A0G4PVQ2_PENC3|nr:RTA1 like protein [Penicillium camemberti]
MGDSGGDIDFQLYRYTPSFAAAVVFIVLFFLTTLYHICQLVKSRSWYFIAFVMGGIRKLLNLSIMPQFLFFGDSPQAYHADPSDPKVQIIGYIARAMAHTNTKSVPIYAIQIILILLAPPLYAASIYMVLGRLILHLRAQLYSVVPLKWMTGIFVTGDVIAFLMQAAGMSHMFRVAWCILPQDIAWY